MTADRIRATLRDAGITNLRITADDQHVYLTSATGGPVPDPARVQRILHWAGIRGAVANAGFITIANT